MLNKKTTSSRIELADFELNAEFYYHGTNKWYFDGQVRKHGRYQHDPFSNSPNTPHGLCIAPNDPNLCVNYACDRARSFAQKPIVLKIKGDNVRLRIYSDPTENVPVIDFLDMGEFEIIEVCRDRYFEWARKHRS